MRELRPLVKENIELIRKTRNAVREWLFYTEYVSPEQQLYWYENVYVKSSERIFLCYNDDKYIGCCQFHPDNNRIAIKMESEYQGLGHGYHFLCMLLHKISGVKVIAKIKLSNIWSINLFIKVGFKVEEIKNYVIIMSRL